MNNTNKLNVVGVSTPWINDVSVFMSRKLMKKLSISVGDILILHDKLPLVVKELAERSVVDSNIVFLSRASFDKLNIDTKACETQNHLMSIGCDPEFILLNRNGRIVNADSMLSHDGQLGSDGALGEIRPDPSDSVESVVESMRKLIRKISTYTHHFPVGTSYYKGYVAGFHLHFQFPEKIIHYCDRNSAAIMREIVSILDYCIGIPSMLFDETDKRRLGQSDYGKAGDFRVSDKTLEYRVPGGIFLRHPEYSRMLLYCGHVVMRDILGKLLVETNGWTEEVSTTEQGFVRGFYEAPDKEAVRYALSSPDRRYARILLNRCRESLLNKLTVNKTEESYITKFLDMDKQKASEVITDNW